MSIWVGGEKGDGSQQRHKRGTSFGIREKVHHHQDQTSTSKLKSKSISTIRKSDRGKRLSTRFQEILFLFSGGEGGQVKCVFLLVSKGDFCMLLFK